MAPRLIAGFAVLAALLAWRRSGHRVDAATRRTTAGPLVVRRAALPRLHLRSARPHRLRPGARRALRARSGSRTGPSKGVVLELAGGPGQSSAYSFDGPNDLWDGWTQVAYDNRGHRPVEPDRLRAVRRPRLARRHHALQRPPRPRARLLLDARQRRRHGGGPAGSSASTSSRIWGTSYGTKQALAYAQEYPSHVDRLLLDSTLLPAGPDVYDLQYGRSVPTRAEGALRAVALQARDAGRRRGRRRRRERARARSRSTRRVTLTPGQAAARPPRRRTSVLEPRRLDRPQLSAREPPALGAARREGGPVRRARAPLVALRRRLRRHARLHRQLLRAGLRRDDVRRRRLPLARAHAGRRRASPSSTGAWPRFPPDAFGVFGRWVQADSYSSICLGWESTGLSPLASTGFPDVPVLVVSGDSRHPDADRERRRGHAPLPARPPARLARLGAQRPQLLRVRRRGASTAGSRAARRRRSATTTRTHFVLPLVPGSVAAAPALAPGGKIGRTPRPVVATLDELHTYGRLVDSFSLRRRARPGDRARRRASSREPPASRR